MVYFKRAEFWHRTSKDADVEAMKQGEYPPFSVPISSKIQKLLSESDLELYRKGSRAEAQGLGIGAATYFRRIVERQWQNLVTEIRNAAEQLGVDDLGVYDAALQETQFSKAVGRYCQVDVERANLSRRADFLCSHRTAQVTSCQTMKARSRSSR